MAQKYTKETRVLDGKLLKELPYGPECLGCGSELQEGREVFILRYIKTGRIKAGFCNPGCASLGLAKFLKDRKEAKTMTK